MSEIRFLVLLSVATLILIVVLASSIVVIDTGNVGVYSKTGRVSKTEIPSGFSTVIPLVSSVTVYSAKENQIDLADLTPKAADNLSLRDFDVTVYYRVFPSQIADLAIKYALPPVRNSYDVIMPIYELIRKQARGAAYQAVAKIPSLEIHKKREKLSSMIKQTIQNNIDESDKGTTIITRVIIRSIRTDSTVEKSIQEAVSAEKKLQAKQVQVSIAKKDAEIEIARARGIAQANSIINDSLTPEYLQHEMNEALKVFAEKGNSSVVVPANMGNMQMLLPSRQLGGK